MGPIGSHGCGQAAVHVHTDWVESSVVRPIRDEERYPQEQEVDERVPQQAVHTLYFYALLAGLQQGEATQRPHSYVLRIREIHVLKYLPKTVIVYWTARYHLNTLYMFYQHQLDTHNMRYTCGFKTIQNISCV